jgi:MFS transporter, PPP family, 3-phenylpropionic acid transporter
MAAATTPNPPNPLLATPVRQAGFYVLLFSMTGVNLPYMPMWLRDQGITAQQIGVILAVPLLLRSLSGPLSGLWADRFTLYRTPMVWLAVAACLFYALMGLGNLYGPWRFLAFLILYACAYTCSTSISPMLDSMTLQLSRSHGFTYAVPRSVGSFAFIVADIMMGWLLLILPPHIILFWVVCAVGLIAILGRIVLPPEPRQDRSHLAADETTGSGFARLKTLLAAPGLVWLFVAIACLQASHSFYYAFSTLIWKEAGLSSAWCGYLWAIGVIGEIVYMMLGERFRRYMGPWRMILLAATVTVFRWCLMMWDAPLWILAVSQLLHIFSFAATYMAGLELVYRLTPRGYEGLAQTINAAYSNGVMMGLGTLASGIAFAHFGLHGYGLMAGLATVGLLCAVRLYRLRTRLTP